jgi:hypothetical protein
MFNTLCELIFDTSADDLRYADLRSVRDFMLMKDDELEGIDVIYISRNPHLLDHLGEHGESVLLPSRPGCTAKMIGKHIVIETAESIDNDELCRILNANPDLVLQLFQHLPEVDKEELDRIAQEQNQRELEEMLTAAVASLSQNYHREKERKKQNYEQALVAMRQAYDDWLKYGFVEENDYQESLKQALRNEIGLIRNHKKVANIRFSRDSMQISTTELTMFEPESGKYYALGAMDIHIQLNGRFDIKFYNQTRRVNGFFVEAHHPHVDASGTPCLGNIDSQLNQYITERKYYAAFVTCLGYLQTANVGDVAGRSVTRWPRCDKDGNLLSTEEHNEDGYEDDDDYHECSVCNEYLAPGDERTCVVCTNPVHDHCGQLIDGQFVCNDCVEYRDDNEIYWCHECQTYHIDTVHPDVRMEYADHSTHVICRESAQIIGWRCQECEEWFHDDVPFRDVEMGRACATPCL